MVRLIYITCPNKAEAISIGKALVQAQLVACVNIIDGVDSIYIWEEKLVEDREVVLIAKTIEEKVEKVISMVKSLHSYHVPCVVSFAIEDGNSDYLNWVKNSVI